MSRFYDTRRWRRCSAAYLAANPLCAVCAELGRTVAATQVDHVIPLERNTDPWNWAGLSGLCNLHHYEKTLIIEQGKHLAGCDATGTPRSPLHPWNTHV